MLLFDEASSALDTETETAVMQAVSQLDPNSTLFIIAYRVQTLRECGLVMKLEEGELVAFGSYEEVLGQDVIADAGSTGEADSPHQAPARSAL